MESENLPPPYVFKVEPTKLGVDDPFENDLFNRKEEADRFIDIITQINQSAVIAVSGGFGSGKSYFVRSLERILNSDGYNAFLFDAWKNDSSDDAFGSFALEISNNLDPRKKEKPLIENIKKIAGTTAKLGGFLALSVGTRLLISDTVAKKIESFELSEEEVSELAKSIGSESLERLRANKAAEEEFKKQFEKLVDDKVDKKMFVFIDELDRCRPDFALDLLERVKHLFSVPKVVFVISVDIEQLGSLVSARYGQQTRSDDYLRKFIDWNYELSSPNVHSLIIRNFTQILKIDEKFPRFKANDGIKDGAMGMSYLAYFSKAFNLSPRAINQLTTSIHLSKQFDGEHLSFLALCIKETLRLFLPKVYQELTDFENNNSKSNENITKFYTALGKTKKETENGLGQVIACVYATLVRTNASSEVTETILGLDNRILPLEVLQEFEFNIKIMNRGFTGIGAQSELRNII